MKIYITQLKTNQNTHNISIDQWNIIQNKIHQHYHVLSIKYDQEIGGDFGHQKIKWHIKTYANTQPITMVYKTIWKATNIENMFSINMKVYGSVLKVF